MKKTPFVTKEQLEALFDLNFYTAQIDFIFKKVFG